MKTESKIVGLTMALALSAGSVAQAAGEVHRPEQSSAVELLKSLRTRQSPATMVETTLEAGTDQEGYTGFTDRVYLGYTDRVYTGFTDRVYVGYTDRVYTGFTDRIYVGYTDRLA